MDSSCLPCNSLKLPCVHLCTLPASDGIFKQRLNHSPCRSSTAWSKDGESWPFDLTFERMCYGRNMVYGQWWQWSLSPTGNPYDGYSVPIVSLLMDSWPSPQTGKFAHVLSIHVDIVGTVEEATWGNDNRLLKALLILISFKVQLQLQSNWRTEGWSSRRIIASWGHPSLNHMRLYLE